MEGFPVCLSLIVGITLSKESRDENITQVCIVCFNIKDKSIQLKDSDCFYVLFCTHWKESSKGTRFELIFEKGCSTLLFQFDEIKDHLTVLSLVCLSYKKPDLLPFRSRHNNRFKGLSEILESNCHII